MPVSPLSPKTFNTILYCKNWSATVAFYRDILELSITFGSDWFIEFQVTETARLSVADEQRASIKSSAGRGLTLTFQVEDADKSWQHLQDKGVSLGPVKTHPWGARVFYFHDPEGQRLEFWSLLNDNG